MARMSAVCAALLFSASSLSAVAGCLDDIKAAGTLRAGTSVMDLRPFLWQNTDGSYQGFEADMLKEIGKRIGVAKTEFVVTESTTLIPGLKAKRWDIIFSSLAVTQERIQKANILFSRPYFLEYDVFIVKTDSPVQSVADLKGRKIASTLGSNDSLNAHRMVSEGKLGEVLDFNSFGEPFVALQNGQVDAVLLDQATLLGQQQKMKNLRVVGEPIMELPKKEWVEAESKASYKFGATSAAIRSECTDLLSAVNGALEGMDKDGTRQKILTKYDAWSPQQASLTK